MRVRRLGMSRGHVQGLREPRVLGLRHAESFRFRASTRGLPLGELVVQTSPIAVARTTPAHTSADFQSTSECGHAPTSRLLCIRPDRRNLDESP